MKSCRLFAVSYGPIRSRRGRFRADDQLGLLSISAGRVRRSRFLTRLTEPFDFRVSALETARVQGSLPRFWPDRAPKN
jgi:hypothetical protein